MALVSEADTPALAVRRLSFTYAGSEAPALRGVDLTIPRGQLWVVLGPTGAGKTTLCYALAGFIPHALGGEMSGVVELLGQDTRQAPLSALTRRVGLVPSNPRDQISGSKATVLEEVAFGLENLGAPRTEMQRRVRVLLEQMGLAHLATRSPLALSGGEQQRVVLASIMVMEPAVLVLDEPASFLDAQGERQLLSELARLQQQGTTVVWADYRWGKVVEMAQQVLVLHQGAVRQRGSTEAVLRSWVLGKQGIALPPYVLVALEAQEQSLWPEGQPLPLSAELTLQGFLSG